MSSKLRRAAACRAISSARKPGCAEIVTIAMAASRTWGRSLEHAGADLHAQRDHFIHRQAGAPRVLPARLRVGRLKLAEGVFAVSRQMTANPRHPGDLGANGLHLFSDALEL